MSREQEFLNAARTGDQKTFLNILNDHSTNIDPNHTDEEDNTALIWAASTGQAAIVNILLADDRTDPNLADEDGETALIIAARNGYRDIISDLLADDRIDPNHADDFSNTALILAACWGRGDIIRALLTNTRIEPNLADEDGDTALIWVARLGHGDILRVLLADERVNPNRANELGNTALILAAQDGDSVIVSALLADQRVNPNLANNMGETALIWAAEIGHGDIVDILLAHTRIDLSHADQAKKAIIIATKNKHDKTLLLLLRFSSQRLSDDEIANLADSDRGFYKRILTRLLWRTRFRGIVRLMIYFRRMRLRAAEAVYAPGGTGFDAAAERFSTAVASHQLSSTSTLTSTETNDITVGITQATDEPGEPATKKQRT